MFGFNIFNMIPTIDTNIQLGMLFLTGLFTSIHCISMCGAINLYASASKEDAKIKKLKNPLLYNIGRLVSYTILGGIIGGIGKVYSICILWCYINVFILFRNNTTYAFLW